MNKLNQAHARQQDLIFNSIEFGGNLKKQDIFIKLTVEDLSPLEVKKTYQLIEERADELVDEIRSKTTGDAVAEVDL